MKDSYQLLSEDEQEDYTNNLLRDIDRVIDNFSASSYATECLARTIDNQILFEIFCDVVKYERNYISTKPYKP